MLRGPRVVQAAALGLRTTEPALYQGLGLFETVGCQDGQPLLWAWHSQRLLASAAELFSACPLLPGEGDIRRLLQRCGLAEGAAVVRVVWWLGRREAVAWAMRFRPPRQRRRQGVELVSLAFPSTPWCAHKVTSYLPWKLAAWQASRQGATALLVEPTGQVRETDHANLFAVFGRRVVTPPAPPRALPGVLRRYCLAALGQCGFAPEVRDLTLAELLSADGAFLTSSLAGVVPVRRVDGQELPRPREVLQRLQALGVPAPGYRLPASGL